MNAQYEEVDNFIVNFGFGEQPQQWQTVAFIGGRFELTLVVPVTVDYSKRTLTQAGAPKFHLCAAQSIRMLDGDQPETTYDAKLGREFGIEEWNKFVHSGFDLTSFGIPKSEVHSIPHWKEYVHACRSDRVQIK